MNRVKTIFVLLLSIVVLFTTNILSGTNQDGQYLAFAEVMPEPIGGIGAIIKTISYPEMAKRSGIEGKVYVQAHINENGDAEEVNIVRGIGAGCDEAAIEALKKITFSPGIQRGRPVKVRFVLPVNFKLNSN